MKPPKDWRVTLNAIREMRKDRTAPVDIVGCHMLAAPFATEKERRFQVLVALMLSSQTKDEITAGAMSRLHKLPLTVDTVMQAEESHLSSLIYPVGFYRRKAAHIKRVATILKESYGGDIPDTLEDLVSLPGVGPKMAVLTLQNAWDKSDSGIGVDVHVHRIANRLGWVASPTKEPEDTRKQLEDWLPVEHWREINPLLVGFGQTLCLPVKPQCDRCLLKDSCPASSVKKTFPVSRKRKISD